MNLYKASVTILPKDGVLDIQGKAVEKTLLRQGYRSVEDVRVGKIIRMNVSAEDETAARSIVEVMASDLLANDLIESFSVELEQTK